ncbi:hypothetical protein A9Q84_13650 [Halobacteriovorax marinus]|uniref:Uncharacterized protein n=1 Tax=Halobacteriovorax marinus TaxID=97084 RepID=A0A1Y5F993_9BACT|nr:hypothetical protein A9Q84_13650 [Halobacteriovorax marinus]
MEASYRDPTKSDYYSILIKNYQQVFSEKESAGVSFPYHLKKEFRRFLSCGVMAEGFARFHCSGCRRDKLVAFSCKGRSICPSCSGRRMNDTAIHLMDEVIPEVPVRQWVLSMPYSHRFILSSNNDLLRKTLAIYHRVISSFYTNTAKKLNLNCPKVGSICVIQRFGGSINLNVHFHSLFMDGVYFENSLGEQVFKEIIPTDEDIHRLVHKIKTRVDRCFKRSGVLEEDSNEKEELQLSLIKSESIQNRVDAFNKPGLIGKLYDAPYEEFEGRKCSYVEGFSLHANVKILAHQRSSLERLCRYVARGPVAMSRVSLSRDGYVYLKLKNPYRDGTSHLEFTPEQFIKRLISIIPPRRQNFIRYFGVFGARHRNRKEITSKATGVKVKKKTKKLYRTPWADLLRRVYSVDVSSCSRCGYKLELIATITNLRVCKKILDHLRIDSDLVDEYSPRGPPELDDSSNFEESFYNQEHCW